MKELIPKKKWCLISVLEKCYVLICLTIFFAIPAQAQETPEAISTVQLRGIVHDHLNNTLPGVSVRSASGGTSTDFNGRFSLKTTLPAALTISSMGYKTQTVTVNSLDTLKFILQEDNQNLSEVVVTALGVKKEKAKLGYAVQEVKGEALDKAREPNYINSLTGKVAGLNIQNSTDMFQNPGITLRGRTPLFVIDGIPDQQADIWKVNADDIESISVLKGAAASALYGSIGLNGAVMITTKRGKGKDLSVEFNSSTIFQTGFIRIPKVQTIYGNGNKGQYAYVDGQGAGTEGAGWIWGPKMDQVDPSTPSGYWETPQYNSPVNSETGELVPLPFISRGKDNIKNFFNTGLITTNNVSLTQSSEKGSFRASLSHIYQKGVVPNTSLQNASINLSGNYNLSKKLQLDARLNYNRAYSDNFPEVGYGPTNYLYNLVLWTGTDVDVRDLRNYWQAGQEGVQQRHFNTSWYNNPYFQAYEFLRGYTKDNVFGSVTLNYQIANGLSASLRSGINQYNLNRDWKEPKSYVGYSNFSRGNYTTAASNYFDIVTDAMLKYDYTFSDNFGLHAELGGSNFYMTKRQQWSKTDGLAVPQFYNLSNSSGPLQSENRMQDRRILSAYGFVDLQFYKSFYLTLTGRQDKVSTLPLKNNSYFYPSVTGSVIVSELATLPKWVSYLKVRGGWSRVSSGAISGVSSNQITNPAQEDDFGDNTGLAILQGDAYGYIPSYDKGTIWNGVPSLNYGSLRVNPNIKPQTSDSWEAGLEFKLIKNRLGVDVTYYQTRDYNNIYRIPVSVGSGYELRQENSLEFQRKGWEFMLNATPVQGNFTWNVSVNASTFRNYLTETYENQAYLGRLKKGDRVDKIFATVYEKSPDGQIVYQSNGMPKEDPFSRPVGYSQPDLVFGIENAFSYKNFTFRFQFDGRLGGSMFSTTNQKMWWGGQHPGTVNQFREDANNNLATYVGRGVTVTSGEISYDENGNTISDTRVFAPNTTAVNYIDFMTTTSNATETNNNYYSQTFVKLREVTLSYQVPAEWLSKTKVFRGANVSLVGRNLLLFSKLPNVDPDRGLDDLQTPSTRNIGFNINLQF